MGDLRSERRGMVATPKRRLTTEQLVWENPPADNHGHGKNHKVIAAALKANPGVFANIGTYSSAQAASSMAHYIRRAKGAAYAPPGAFEAVARTVDGQHRVYACYVGVENA